MNERELVLAAKSGDFGAFNKLIAAHKDKIYGLAIKLSGNEQDAEDIIQDTFLKAIDRIDQFRMESAFGTWLYSIALNEARAHLAKRKKTDLKPLEEYLPKGHTSEESDHSELFDWKDPHTILENEELRQITNGAISRLPYVYKEAFVLRYIDGLSVKEVAELTGESDASTKSRILRARLALRDDISKIFEDKYGRKMPGIH